jgi:hypothetical protein
MSEWNKFLEIESQGTWDFECQLQTSSSRVQVPNESIVWTPNSRTWFHLIEEYIEKLFRSRQLYSSIFKLEAHQGNSTNEIVIWPLYDMLEHNLKTIQVLVLKESVILAALTVQC